MVALDPCRGRYLTVTAVFCGCTSTKEADEQILSMQNRHSGYFVEWILSSIKTPGGFKDGCHLHGQQHSQVHRCSIACLSSSGLCSGTKLPSTGTVVRVGFTEAQRDKNDLVSEYQQYQDVTAEEEGKFEEEGEEEIS